MLPDMESHYPTIVAHRWSKVNEWPEDGFVKAETGYVGLLFDYTIPL
jgi:hypothetical protein